MARCTVTILKDILFCSTEEEKVKWMKVPARGYSIIILFKLLIRHWKVQCRCRKKQLTGKEYYIDVQA